MSEFQGLVLKHHGAVFCVIGGAPGADAQLKRASKADVFISANEHGAKLREVDYVVAMDDIHAVDKDPMRARIRQHTEAPIIGVEPCCDVRIPVWPMAPRKVYSGLIAIWVAWTMGAKVILVTGMNGYDGDPTFMERARTIAKAVRCEVRVVGGGPLTSIWPAFRANEKFADYVPHPSLDGVMGADTVARIRVLRKTQIEGIDRLVGETFSVQRHAVRAQLKHGMVEEL